MHILDNTVVRFISTRTVINQTLTKLLGWGHLLLVGKSHHGLVQFLRYGLVACAALAVDVGLLVAFTELIHLHYILSATLSFSAGLLVNYALSVAWVFPERSLQNRFAEFSAFALIGVVGLVLNDLLIWFLTDRIHLFYLYSKLVATVIIFFWNFLMRKYLLFITKSKNS